MSIYYSLIYSKLIYCISIWGGTYKTYLHSLIVVQKRVLRTISYKSRYETTANIFTYLKLFNINHIHMYFCALLVFKYLNSNYCSGTFQRVNHVYATRAAIHDLLVPIRSRVVSNSVLYNAPKCWNALPLSIKNLVQTNIARFKLHSKKHLLDVQRLSLFG